VILLAATVAGVAAGLSAAEADSIVASLVIGEPPVSETFAKVELEAAGRMSSRGLGDLSVFAVGWIGLLDLTDWAAITGAGVDATGAVAVLSAGALLGSWPTAGVPRTVGGRLTLVVATVFVVGFVGAAVCLRLV
jgi:hypothetical protein